MSQSARCRICTCYVCDSPDDLLSWIGRGAESGTIIGAQKDAQKGAQKDTDAFWACPACLEDR